MTRLKNKVILVAFWIIVVFGYLYLLQFAYDKEKSFHLFVLLAIAGNMAYDGLKTIINYNPLYPSDATTVVKYIIGFIACMGASLVSIFFGAALLHWKILNAFSSQFIAGGGFLMSMALGMFLLSKAETRFGLSSRT